MKQRIFVYSLLIAFAASALMAAQGDLDSALSVWMFVPAIWFFLIGKFKDRFRNALPIFALALFLMVGSYTGEWNAALWIFFFVPYVALLLKPRRHIVKYITLALSTLYLIFGLATGVWLPVGFRIAMVIIIYMIFIPPMLFAWCMKPYFAFKRRLKRWLPFFRN